MATSIVADPHHKASDSSRYPSEQESTAPPSRPSATAVDTQQERPDITTTIISQPTTFTSNTATTTSIPFTTTTNQISTTKPSAAKRHPKTLRSTIRTITILPESPKTTPRIPSSSTSKSAKLDPSKSTLGPPRAAATEGTLLRCNITDKMWIKTGVIAQKSFKNLIIILIIILNTFLKLYLWFGSKPKF